MRVTEIDQKANCFFQDAFIRCKTTQDVLDCQPVYNDFCELIIELAHIQLGTDKYLSRVRKYNIEIDDVATRAIYKFIRNKYWERNLPYDNHHRIAFCCTMISSVFLDEEKSIKVRMNRELSIDETNSHSIFVTGTNPAEDIERKEECEHKNRIYRAMFEGFTKLQVEECFAMLCLYHNVKPANAYKNVVSLGFEVYMTSMIRRLCKLQIYNDICADLLERTIGQETLLKKTNSQAEFRDLMYQATRKGKVHLCKYVSECNVSDASKLAK